MKCSYCIVFLLFLTAKFMATNCSSSNWWSLGLTTCGQQSQPGESESCPNCARLKEDGVLDSEQERLCRTKSQLKDSLARGAHAAIVDCQRRFNESKWNCTTLYGPYLFGAFVANSTTRETGVLNVYFVAGAISSISQDCHEQKISDCPCIVENPRSEDADGNVVFQSCKADYDFAANLTKTFVSRSLNITSPEGKIDQHNIHVGAKVVNVEVEECRCHGVSGTCTVQTCYTRTHTVAEVGQQIFERYGGAVQVEESSSGEIVNAKRGSTPYSNSSIIYKDSSPNFCVYDIEKGTVGVGDRLCNENSNERNACSSTCCDRGHYTVIKTEPVEECDFIWCCRIDCRFTGNRTIIEHRCNPDP